jgi:hypothetical protein
MRSPKQFLRGCRAGDIELVGRHISHIKRHGYLARGLVAAYYASHRHIVDYILDTRAQKGIDWKAKIPFILNSAPLMKFMFDEQLTDDEQKHCTMAACTMGYLDVIKCLPKFSATELDKDSLCYYVFSSENPDVMQFIIDRYELSDATLNVHMHVMLTLQKVHKIRALKFLLERSNLKYLNLISDLHVVPMLNLGMPLARFDETDIRDGPAHIIRDIHEIRDATLASLRTVFPTVIAQEIMGYVPYYTTVVIY